MCSIIRGHYNTRTIFTIYKSSICNSIDSSCCYSICCCNSIIIENYKTLKKFSEVLGLKKEILVKESKIKDDEILSLINQRLKAKKEKNYAKADEIRNLLKEKGIELIDQSKEITTWIRV